MHGVLVRRVSAGLQRTFRALNPKSDYGNPEVGAESEAFPRSPAHGGASAGRRAVRW